MSPEQVRANPTERRRDPRQPLWFPVRIDVEGAPSWVAVCRDASATGLLLAAPDGSSFRVGDAVVLSFRTPTDNAPHTVRGKIARMIDNPGDDGFLWPQLLGIELDQPDPSLGGLLAAIVKPDMQ